MADSDSPHTVVPDLKRKGQELLDNEHDGIQSAVLHECAGNKTHLFAIPEGDAFPTHDTPRRVMNHVVAGEARVEIGGDDRTAGPNTWIHVPPNVPHSIDAITPFVFTLHTEPVEA